MAEAACAASTTLDAVDQWSKAFKHFFPMVESPALASDNVIKSSAVVSVTRPDVLVTATSRDNPNLKWTGTNRIGPIPKRCDIHFRLSNPGMLPAGTTVEWMVRNEGSEAENINDLGHSSGTGYEARDTSAYVGTHYMDCILRHIGKVIMVRRIPVTITGVAAPPRNPVNKPQYVWIRGRR